MKVFTVLCMVALAVGHPVKEQQADDHVAIHNDKSKVSNEHHVHKRSVQTNENNYMVKEDDEDVREDIIQKRSVHGAEDHVIKKRDTNGAEDHVIKKRDTNDGGDGLPAQNDCGQTSGDASQNCEEQNVDDHVIQKRDAQSVEGKAYQDDESQVAYSNEGGYAKQGQGGQYIYASDFGGPMVQILQHVYKSNCCACGCDCGCELEGAGPTGEAATGPPGEATTGEDGTTTA